MRPHSRHSSLLFGSLILTLVVCPSIGAAPKKNPPPAGSALVVLLADIQTGLQMAQDHLDDSKLPPLESVQLTLRTETQEGVGGKISLFVITIGGGGSVNNAQELVLTLVPPKAGDRLPAASNDIAKSIAALVEEASTAVRAAQNGTPPLKADSLTMEFGFNLTKSGSAGIKLVFAPVSVEASGDIKKIALQKAKITFKLPKPA